MTSITKPLHDAYATTGYVSKSKENKLQNYKYADEASMIKALRPALHDAGLTVYPVNIELLHDSQYTNAKGTTFNRIVLKYTFRFSSAENGTFFDVVSIGEGVDSSDKASYKAATGALKYALKQALLIETGEDPEELREEMQAKENAEKIEAVETFAFMKEIVEKATNFEDLSLQFFSREGKLKSLKSADATNYALLDKKYKDKLLELMRVVGNEFIERLNKVEDMVSYEKLSSELKASQFLKIANVETPILAEDVKKMFGAKKQSMEVK